MEGKHALPRRAHWIPLEGLASHNFAFLGTWRGSKSRRTRPKGKETNSSVYTDHSSGAVAERAELARALDHLRGGDTLVVWRLDRLGRSLDHLVETAGALEGEASAFARSPSRSTRRAARADREDRRPTVAMTARIRRSSTGTRTAKRRAGRSKPEPALEASGRGCDQGVAAPTGAVCRRGSRESGARKGLEGWPETNPKGLFERSPRTYGRHTR